MADETLLDFNPFTGMREWISTDETTGESFIRYEQDVAPIMDQNNAMHLEGLNKRAEVWKVGHIPDTVILEWRFKHGVDLYNPAHRDGVRKLLNSAEYARLNPHNIRL